MKKIILVIFLLLFSFTWSQACICAELDRETVSFIFNKSDYVVIGKAVSFVHPDANIEKLQTQRREGDDVIFQIDSVLKGDVTQGEALFIYQFAGSCTRNLEYGESYLIFGQSIKKFKVSSYTRRKTKENISSIVPPPPEKFKSMKLELHADKGYVRFLNNKLKRFKTMTTGLCSSFYVDSISYDEIIVDLN